jgi:hypothetical protein
MHSYQTVTQDKCRSAEEKKVANVGPRANPGVTLPLYRRKLYYSHIGFQRWDKKRKQLLSLL